MLTNVFIVIPAYNEATVIGRVLTDLRRSGYYNIIVVDDGSADETCQEARNSGDQTVYLRTYMSLYP